MYKTRSSKGYFQFEIIINVLVSSLCFFWTPILWIYCHYYCVLLLVGPHGDRVSILFSYRPSVILSRGYRSALHHIPEVLNYDVVGLLILRGGLSDKNEHINLGMTKPCLLREIVLGFFFSAETMVEISWPDPEHRPDTSLHRLKRHFKKQLMRHAWSFLLNICISMINS